MSGENIRIFLILTKEGNSLNLLIKTGIKIGEKIVKSDLSNPITQDSTDFLLQISKHVLDLFF